MIEQVHLRDFKSHQETLVTFQPGANALLGHNGAGKTSVLQAIGLCLFDVGRPGAWVRKGCKTGRATVTFRAVDGERYSVERRVGSSGARLMDASGAVLTTGSADVYQGVRDLLGLEPGEDLKRLWEELVGVPQGRLTAAFADTERGRRAVFDAILRVDEYRAAHDKLRDTASHAKQRVDDARSRRDRLDGMLEGAADRHEAMQDAERAVHESAKQVDAAEAEAKKADAALVELRTRRDAAQALRDEVERAERARLTAQQARDAATREVQAAEEAAAWLVQHQARIEAVEAAEALLSDEADAIAAAREALAEHKRLAQAVPDAEARVEKARASLASLEKQVADAPDFEALRTDRERQAAEAERTAEAMRAAEAEREEAQRTVAKAESEADERARLESDAKRAEAMQPGTEARDALRAAETERESTRRLADALEAQFVALADGRTCPILDVTCPVTDVDLDAKRTERAGDLEARAAHLDKRLPALRQAAEAESESERWLAAWNERRPRLAEMQQRAGLAEEARAALPKLAGAVEQARTTHENARKALQATDAALATEAQVRLLQTTVATQRAALAEDEAHLADLRARLEAAAREHDAHAALDAHAREAESLLRREVGFVRELAVQRNAASGLAERAAALESAGKEHATAEHTAVRARSAADAAWGADDEKSLVAAEATARDAGTAHARVQSEATALERRLSETRAAVQRDEQVARDLDAAETELAKALRVEALVRRVRGLIKDLGPHVAERFVERVSVAADEHFRDLTGGRPARLWWDRDYEVCVTDADGHVRTFGDLSGGEQVMAALAVRLSLLRSLSPVPFAVYDEPTLNLDDEVRRNVARVLEHAGRSQLIVVSHDDAFSESIHNAVRLRRDGTRSVLEEAVHA